MIRTVRDDADVERRLLREDRAPVVLGHRDDEVGAPPGRKLGGARLVRLAHAADVAVRPGALPPECELDVLLCEHDGNRRLEGEVLREVKALEVDEIHVGEERCDPPRRDGRAMSLDLGRAAVARAAPGRHDLDATPRPEHALELRPVPIVLTRGLRDREHLEVVVRGEAAEELVLAQAAAAPRGIRQMTGHEEDAQTARLQTLVHNPSLVSPRRVPDAGPRNLPRGAG